MTLGWVALLLLVAVTGSNGDCEGDAPTAAILCHIENSIHPSTNPCLCTHMVVHDKDLLKDVEQLKVKNSKLKILTVESSSKPELSKELDGLYINLDKPPSKEVLIEDLKALATSLDNLQSSKRAKAKYNDDKEKKATDEMEIIMELPAEPPQLAKFYDLKALTKYVNYFVVPSYNLTDSTEDGLAYHPSRLMGIDDILNADSLVDLLSGMGADHSQMILSLPAFALHFNLKDETKNMPRSPVSSSPKKLSQAQLCKMVEEGGWTLERDEDLTAPYAYKKTDWVSFDDTTSASIKGKYVLLRNMGGVSIASSENDDWSHSCNGRPIVDTLHNTFTQLSRKSRAAQLLSLQDQIHNSLVPFAGDVQLSPFRIVRVVDRSGSVHVVRKEAKTEFECSRQGYFTHPSGCNRFYRCVKFNQYSSEFTVFEYDCPAGLAFDERYEVCVWPGSLPDASACKGSSEIAPVPRSRYACSTEGYYADPENCRWFFACLDHHRDGHTPPTAYEFRCPFGLVFDGNTLACDWPWKVPGCGSGGAAYATVGSGTLYPGDILEGRLRPAYASVSDVHVSGGRIHGVDGGHVLGTTLLSGLSSQNNGAYAGYGSYGGLSGSGSYGGLSGSGSYGGLSGSGSYGGSSGDQSGAYVHDPTGDNGGEYVHQDVPYVHQEGDQSPYRHQEGLGSPYVHQGDSGSYVHQGDSGSYHGTGGYVHQGDSGAYVHQGDSGSYKGSGGYVQQGDNGAYLHQGDSGSYKGSGGYVQQGDSGNYKGSGYVQQGDSGSYIHQGDSGNYKGSGYVQQGDSGAYLHQGDSGSYKGSGGYVHQGDSGNYKGSGYVQQGDSGAYVHQGDSGNYKGSGYVHQGDVGTYVQLGDSGTYKGSGTYYGSGSYAQDNRDYYPNTIGSSIGTTYASKGTYSGSTGEGAYVHDSTGDSGGAYVHDDKAFTGLSSYASDVKTGGGYSSVYSGAGGYSQGGYVSGIKTGTGYTSGLNTGYVHDTRGDYDVKTGGSFISNSGSYVHDTRGDYGGAYVAGHEGAYIHDNRNYQGSYYGGKYQVGQGSQGYINQGLYRGSAQYGSGAYVHDTRGDYGGGYYQGGYKISTPVNTYGIQVNQAHLYQPTAPVIHSYSPTKFSVQDQGYIQHAVKVSPITVTSAPVVPLKPVQYIQPQVRPVVVTTPAPQIVGYHYEKQPSVSHIPITVTSAPSIPLNPVQYVKQIQPVQKIQPIVLSTPSPPVINYSYRQPVVSTVRPSIAVSSTPVVPYNPVQYVSTPAPPVLSYHQPTIVETKHIQPVSGYNYAKPSIRFDLPRPSSPTYVRFEQPISTPAPSLSYTVQPITVSSTPRIPLSPVQYNVGVPCTTCAVAQTARPITVTSSPVVQSGYDYPKPAIKFETPVQAPQPAYVDFSYKQPHCASCASAQTARPITVSSTPIVPYNPVQYVSTPSPPVISYTYQKPVYKTQPVQPVYVSTPAPPTVVHYEQPQIKISTPSVSYHSVETQTVRPITVSSTPVVPYNPVQYTPVRPVEYHQTIIKDSHGYSYPKPSVKLELPQYRPVQHYVSTPSPPVVSYQQPVVSYQQPIIKQHFVSTPAPPVVSYQQPIIKQHFVSTPAPPVVSYQQPINKQHYVSTPAPPVVSYQQPIIKQHFVSTPAPPVVSYQQPIIKQHYVSTPAPPVVSYQQPFIKQHYVSTPAPPVVSYQQPIIKQHYISSPAPSVVSYQQPIKTVQQVSINTHPPVAVSYQPQPFKTVTVSPITVSSTPAVPYNPVQYFQPQQQINYSYQPVQTQTVRPYVSSTPVVSYNPVQYKQTEHKSVSYSYPQVIRTQTVRPITVTSAPAVPLNPVQYVQPIKTYVSTPAPQVNYNYYQPAIKTVTQAPVSYSYQPTVSPIVPFVTSKPVVPYNPVQYVKPVEQKQIYSYNYVRPEVQQISVSTPATPVVNYSYQPAVQTQTVRPIVPVVTSKPVVPYNPVQYVKPESKPIFSFSYVRPEPVSTPAPPVVNYSYQPVKPVTYNYVEPQKHIVSTPAPPVVSYSYQPVRTQTVRPVVTSTYEPVQYVKEEHEYNYNYVKPQPFALPTVTPVKESKPIFSFSYVRPEPTVSTIRPAIAVSTTPVVPYSPVQYVKPAKPASFSYTYESPSVQKEDYYYEEKVTPVTSTEIPFVQHKRIKPTVYKTYVTEKPSIGTYFEEYFESNKNQESSKGQYFGSSFSSQDGYKYEQPVVRYEEKIKVPVTKVNTGYAYENGYNEEVHSSSFAPIVVSEVSTTARPIVKKPVQTYVNTVEEENYYSSSASPIDISDENLNIHLDIPRVGVQLSSTTPEQIVEVTSVAPVIKRVRVKGGDTRGGYYIRKQKVRVQPVVTTSENYPSYYTSTVRPVYTSTIDFTSPTLLSTTIRPSSSTVSGAELEIDNDDDKLIQEVSGGFGEIISSGDKGILRQGVSSTTLSSLKDGEAIVGVVKKDREPFTGRKRAKVVVVSRLSEFNPLLVGKLGAECSCKSDTRTLDLSKTSRRRPTTTVIVPSRDYLPTSTTPLPADLTNFDYDDASPPTVEIKPVRKVQRVYSTTGQPIDVSSVEYETSTRPTRKISSGSRKNDESDIDCQRPGLFRHPHLCNKFYSCNWDEWKKRFTVSVFNCPIHLAFDSKLGACNWPSKGPKCSGNNLLV